MDWEGEAVLEGGLEKHSVQVCPHPTSLTAPFKLSQGHPSHVLWDVPKVTVVLTEWPHACFLCSEHCTLLFSPVAHTLLVDPTLRPIPGSMSQFLRPFQSSHSETCRGAHSGFFFFLTRFFILPFVSQSIDWTSESVLQSQSSVSLRNAAVTGRKCMSSGCVHSSAQTFLPVSSLTGPGRFSVNSCAAKPPLL